MGFSMFGLDVPTTKTTSALLCMTKDEVAEADADATACINCGRCVEACPEQIVPSRLSKFSEHGDMAEFENGMVLSVWNVEAAVLSARQNVR